MSIEINGLEGIEVKLEDIADTSNIEQALGEACAIVERSARQKAHKKTGDLRRSIKSKVEDSNTEVKGIVYTPLEYAPYVEYGTGLFAENGGREDVPWRYKDDKGKWHSTSGQEPQPFMRPALDENREEILRILKGALLND